MREPAKFWSKVDTSGDCWLWLAGVDRNGYGRYNDQGRTTFAHRFAYQQIKGDIPNGLVLDHLCRVITCVNPEHLEPVTIGENVRRGIALMPRKTHCKNGHPISGDNIKLRSNGQPRCRECQNKASRDYYRRLAAQKAATP